MNNTVTPENAEKFSFLKDDPEFAEVWEDLKTNGASALQKVGTEEWGGKGGTSVCAFL